MQKKPKEDFDMLDEPIYLCHEDVSMRLDASLVKFNGRPYIAYTNGFNLNLYTIADKNSSVLMFQDISFKDNRLDITAIDIGYTNIDSKYACFYITRAPVRKQKQGSSTINMVTSAAGCKGFYPMPHEMLFNRGIEKAILGDYPSLAEAIPDLKEQNRRSTALSSNFAATRSGKDIILLFDQSDIGTIVPDVSTESGYSAKLKPIYNDSIMNMRLAQLNIGVF